MTPAQRLMGTYLIAVSVGLSGTPVAQVSGTQGLILDGHLLSQAAGVTFWPLVAGDRLSTSNIPAMVSFGDGSRITLAARSRVLVCGTAVAPNVALLAGAMDYRLALDSKIHLADWTGDKAVAGVLARDSGCADLKSGADTGATSSQTGATSGDSGATSSNTGAAAHGSHGLLIGVIAASSGALAVTGAAVAASGTSTPATLPAASQP